MRGQILSLLIGVAAVAAAPFAYPASDSARAFDDLLLQRESALEDATAPVDKQYRQKLEQLLTRATKAGDLETAVRIKDMIAKITRKLDQPSSKQKAQMVGAWDLENHVDGHKGLIDISADGTFSEQGKRLGAWELRDKELILHYDNRGGHQDIYHLPVRNGKLHGINTPGQSLTITRKDPPIEAESESPSA